MPDDARERDTSRFPSVRGRRIAAIEEDRDDDAPPKSGVRSREDSTAVLMTAIRTSDPDSPVTQVLSDLLAAKAGLDGAAKVAPSITASITASLFKRVAAVVILALPVSWQSAGLIADQIRPQADVEALERIERGQSALVQFVVGCEMARRENRPLPDVPATLRLITVQAEAAAEADTSIGH